MNTETCKTNLELPFTAPVDDFLFLWLFFVLYLLNTFIHTFGPPAERHFLTN